jgi:hypothetical protein
VHKAAAEQCTRLLQVVHVWPPLRMVCFSEQHPTEDSACMEDQYTQCPRCTPSAGGLTGATITNRQSCCLSASFETLGCNCRLYVYRVRHLSRIPTKVLSSNCSHRRPGSWGCLHHHAHRLCTVRDLYLFGAGTLGRLDISTHACTNNL